MKIMFLYNLKIYERKLLEYRIEMIIWNGSIRERLL